MSTATLLQALVERASRTLAEDAGIRLRDSPAPLYQLQVLATLLAKPISGETAVAASRELRKADMRTPRAMLEASWQQRVDALGRAGYRRYDESTATRLGEAAELIRDEYGGDLRRLADRADHDRDRVDELLQQLPGIGPTGAAIFLREVQAVWQWVAPYFDDRVLDGARRLGLPHTPAGLSRAIGSREPVRVAAALVRASMDDKLAARVRAAA